MRPIKLTKKEKGLGLLAACLALASLRPTDPWVVFPMLGASFCACLYLAYYHQGSNARRVAFCIVTAVVLVFISYREVSGMFPHTKEVISQLDAKDSNRPNLVAHLVPVSADDTPKHISINSEEQFNVQVDNITNVDAKAAVLRFRTSDGCKFIKMPANFYPTTWSKGQEAESEKIASIPAGDYIRLAFAVRCPDGRSPIRVMLYHQCETCQGAGWGEWLILLIKSQ
jgi:hypothetical protein